MSDAGFVKTWRDDADHPYLQEPDDFFVYHRLRLKAAWMDKQEYVRKKKRVIHLRRGQLWTTTRDLAKQLKMHHSKIVRILERLKIGTLIETDTETGVTIVTICDYDRNSGEDEKPEHQAIQKTARARNSGETQNKKDKNLKEIEERGGGACARDPDQQAQPPPIQIVDQGKNDGSDAPAKEPVPDVLPDAWAEIARTEFVGVDELHPSGNTRLVRCFYRFQKRSRDRSEFMTQKAWIERWREWLLDDFELATNQGSAPAVNGHTNGSAVDGNGHDPPKKQRGKGALNKFLSAGIQICERARNEAKGTKFLMQQEDFELKIQLRKIFEGEDQVLGVDWGPNLNPDEVFARLPQFDRFVQKTRPQAETPETTKN